MSTRLSVFILGGALLAGAAAAQTYPGRCAWSWPVRVVVPFPAVGAADIVARQVTQKLGEAFASIGTGTGRRAEIARRVHCRSARVANGSLDAVQ